jgi:CDGSH-type Zn-finger protein
MMSENEIVIIPHNNGPYEVPAGVKIITQGGRVLHSGARGSSLCRCGQSASKPFCDGTHAKVGFQSDLDALPAAAGSAGHASNRPLVERELHREPA